MRKCGLRRVLQVTLLLNNIINDVGMGISLNSLVDTANPQMYHPTYNQNVGHFSGKVVPYKEVFF